MISFNAAFTKMTSIAFISVILSACGGGDSGLPSTATDIMIPTAPTTGDTTPISQISPDKIVVTLNWIPGSSNVSTVSGYYIYYSGQSTNINQRIDVGNVTAAQLNGNDFNYNEPGNYYFVVRAYDDQGMLSLPSTVALINIQP